MKTICYLLGVVIVVYIIQSCKGPQPMFSNLHSGKINNNVVSGPILDVKVGVLPYKAPPKVEEQAKLLWELPDSLSYNLLSIIGNKTKNADEIITLMSKPIYSEKKALPAELQTNYRDYKIRFVFSNIKKYFNDKRFTHPNTRLAYLNTYICIPSEEQNNIMFYSIEKLENEFEEVDLGGISRNNTVTFNSKLTATGQIGSSIDTNNTTLDDRKITANNANEQNVYDSKGNIVGTINDSGGISKNKNVTSSVATKSGASANISGEIGYLNTETLNEARQVKLLRMKAGFSFSPTEIVVSQEGRQNADITNNVFVDATVRFKTSKLTSAKPIHTFDNLFDDKYGSNQASNIKIAKRPVSYVKCHNSEPLKLAVKFDGLLRVVESTALKTGEKYLEYDDQVTMYHIPETAESYAEIDPSVFCKEVSKVVATTENNEDVDLYIIWKMEEKVGLFSDEKPEEFLRWLESHIENPVLNNLNTNKFQMFFRSSTGKIWIIKDHMQKTDLEKIKKLHNIRLEDERI